MSISCIWPMNINGVLSTTVLSAVGVRAIEPEDLGDTGLDGRTSNTGLLHLLLSKQDCFNVSSESCCEIYALHFSSILKD